MARPKKIVQPADLPVRETHSQVVTVTGGTLVFVAGMTSRSEKDASPVHPGDMRAQLRQVCQNIGRALRSVGADFPDVVKTTTFTTDVEAYHRVADERPDRREAALLSRPHGRNRGHGGDPGGAA